MNEIEWIARKIGSKLVKKGCYTEYGRRKFADSDVINRYIAEMLNEGKPFAVGRMGMVEFDIMYGAETKGPFGQGWQKRLLPNSWLRDEENQQILVSQFRNAYYHMDIICNWYNKFLEEEYIIKRYSNEKALCTTATPLEPYCFDEPWSYYLKEKKVLVISGFSEKIASQYAKRTLLFHNEKILPKFELIPYQAIWLEDYIMQNKCSYQSVYQKYLDDISKIDFDIALVACSSPSFPLVADIKRMGKSAIQMGGSIQILFGIKGARWDNDSFFRDELYNEYWTRLDQEEKPSDAQILDNNCYW